MFPQKRSDSLSGIFTVFYADTTDAEDIFIIRLLKTAAEIRALQQS